MIPEALSANERKYESLEYGCSNDAVPEKEFNGEGKAFAPGFKRSDETKWYP